MRNIKENDIAIIGYAFDFPEGTNTDDKFWMVLSNGEDLVREIPLNRWDWRKIYDPNPNAWGKSYSYHGAFLNSIDKFDANAFRIMPIEAKELDPQQRLVLKTTWRALENSYLNITKLKHSNTGVFIGATMDDYLQLQTRVDCGNNINRYTHFGSVLNDISGRVSFVYGFHGPSMTIDTACSSSISALDSAIKAIKEGDCEIALAGGVNVILNEELYIKFSRTQMLSKTGSCKTFDDSADGYVRGEGCGIIVLQRLGDAIKQNRNIIAVIRGISINHNGNSGGLTVPSGNAQVMLIQNCMKKAGIKPQDVDYLEAHGTGTQLGDKVEVDSLQEVFRDRKKPLLIGSVKTNLGHLESAAGIASIIKVLLCMKHNELVPSIHLKNKNRKINWEKSPVEVLQKNIQWNSKIKIAGISSFGAGGTNGHLIIQKYDKENDENKINIKSEMSKRLYLGVSAKSIISLKNLLISLDSWFADKTDQEAVELCDTYNLVRSDYSYRVVVSGDNVKDLRIDISNRLMTLSDLNDKLDIPDESTKFNIDYDLESYNIFCECNKEYNDCVNDLKKYLADITPEKERIIMGLGLYQFITRIGLKKYLIVGDVYTKFLLMLASKPKEEYNNIIEEYFSGVKKNIKEIEDYTCDDYLYKEINMISDYNIQNNLLSKSSIQYEYGADIRWECFCSLLTINNFFLPGYEFDEQYYWTDYSRHVVDDLELKDSLDDYISLYKIEETDEEYNFTIKLRQDANFISQHRIYQKEVLIGTFQLMLISSISEKILNLDYLISDVNYLKKIDPFKCDLIKIIIQKKGDIKEGKILVQEENSKWQLKTTFSISKKIGNDSDRIEISEINGEFVEKDEFYRQLSCGGLNLGSDYQLIKSIVKSKEFSIALLKESDFIVGILDSASQLLYLYRDNDNYLYMPYYFSSYEQWGSIKDVNRVEGRIINKTEDEIIADLFYYDDLDLVARCNEYHLKLISKENTYPLETIIGEHVKLPDNIDMYQHTIKVSDTSLRDHVVYHRLTIPGAYFVSQMMQYAEFKFGHEQFEISNINFYNAMVLDDNMVIKEITQIKESIEGYEVTICSSIDDSDVFVDNVKMLLNDRNNINSSFLDEELSDKERTNVRYLSKDEIIKIQWKIGLNLNHSFHWIKEAYIYDNSIRANLSNEEFDRLKSTYGTPPGLIDTAVQILGLYKNIDQESEGAYIPLTINKVVQYQKMKRDLKCMVYNIKESGELLIADIVYYDSNNTKVLEFQEICLIKAEKTKLGNLNPNNNLIAQQEWITKQLNNTVNVQYRDAFEIRLGVNNNKIILTNYQINAGSWSIIKKEVYEYNDNVWRTSVLNELTNKKMLVILSDSSEYISIESKNVEDVNTISKDITLFYLNTLKLFKTIDFNECALCFATNHAFTDEVEKDNIFAGVIWGLARSIKLELADYNIFIHDSDKTLSLRVDSISRCIENTLSQATDYNDIIKEPNINEKLEGMNVSSVIISSEKSYVIIGGFGALGLETCKSLVDKGAQRLIIIGRSDLNQKQDEINKLNELKNDLSIEYHKIDVSKSNAESLLNTVLINERSVGGVVYAAGVVKDKTYMNYLEEDIQAVYDSKISGIITMFNSLKNIEYDFCVCFSSIVSVLGAAGQSVYGAANSFIDLYCNYLNKKGKKVFSIQWGPWSDIGMFSKLDMISVKRYESRNIFSMNAHEAMDAFLNGLNYNKNLMIYKRKKVNNDFSFVADKKQLSHLSQDGIEKSIKDQVKDIVAESIGINNPDDLKTNVFLMDLGIDSLLMVEIRMKINKFFNVNISLDLFFEKMTIDNLCDIIENK